MICSQHMSEPAIKLSRNQAHVLLCLYQNLIRGLCHWYPGTVPWRTKGTASERASLSRTLRRLEKRGLLLRVNQVDGPDRKVAADPHDRTTDVLLSPAGIDLAKRLSNPDAENDNHLAAFDWQRIARGVRQDAEAQQGGES
jgi:DNA-binding MarR family transcriptional regulator